jgi:hypothetical protein
MAQKFYLEFPCHIHINIYFFYFFYLLYLPTYKTIPSTTLIRKIPIQSMFNFVHASEVHTHILDDELGNKLFSYTQINMVFVIHSDVQNVECQLLPITNYGCSHTVL